MAPLNVSFNEISSVRPILETSLAASPEAGQHKKVYSLVRQLLHLKISLMMGVFLTVFSMFETMGMMTREWPHYW